MILSGQCLLDLPDAIGNISHYLYLREVDRIHFSSPEVDMNHRSAIVNVHEERWFLHHIMPHIENQVGMRNRSMQEVSIGERGIPQKEWISFIQNPFAHLCAEEGNLKLIDKIPEHSGSLLTVCPSTDQ